MADKSNVPAVKRDEQEAKLEKQLTELATSPEEKAVAFAMLTEYRQSKMTRVFATAIAGQTWGKKMSDYSRAVFARYCLATGTDPARHWEILGDKLYDKAELWMDIATTRADYDGYDHEYAHDDDRLDDADRATRKQLRAQYGIPEAVRGACIVRIYKKNQARPFVGVNWAGSYTTILARTGNEGKHADPIGDENPTKTAFTRAFRRAAKTAWPLPTLKAFQPSNGGGMDVGVLETQFADSIEQGRAALEAGKDPVTGRQDNPQDAADARVSEIAHGTADPEDPYALGQEQGEMPMGKPGRDPRIDLLTRYLDLIGSRKFDKDRKRLTTWAGKKERTVEELQDAIVSAEDRLAP
jgi:hypothetical protein